MSAHKSSQPKTKGVARANRKGMRVAEACGKRIRARVRSPVG